MLCAYFDTMSPDPVKTNPNNYSVILENDRVRVLKYHDSPGTLTLAHDHPDSVMITFSAFQRELIHGDSKVKVSLPAGQALWLSAQSHAGHNIGETDTDVYFVELKEPPDKASDSRRTALGPVS